MAADYGVAVTWGEARGGREQQGLDLFVEVATVYEKAIADGRLDSWDAVIFEPVGGLPGGEIRLYFNSSSELEAYLASDEYGTIFTRAGMLLHNMGMRRFTRGEVLAADLGRYADAISQV